MLARLTTLGASLLLVIGMMGAPAQAQYPDHAVHLVVPNPPGGITDILARIIAQRLSQTWNQPVVVDNRPGGDETIAADSVARSAPDGYTLFVATGAPLTAAPHLHKDIRYDPFKDFTPVMALGEATPVMNVPAALPVHSVAELIALAKAKPGALNYGSFGNGTYAHLGMEDFKQRTGTNLGAHPLQGLGAGDDGAAAERSFSSHRQQEPSGRPREGRHGADHRRGEREAADGFSEPADDRRNRACRGSRPAPIGTCSARLTCRRRYRQDPGRRERHHRGTRSAQAVRDQHPEPMDMSAAEFAAFLRRDYEQQGALIKLVGLSE